REDERKAGVAESLEEPSQLTEHTLAGVNVERPSHTRNRVFAAKRSPIGPSSERIDFQLTVAFGLQIGLTQCPQVAGSPRLITCGIKGRRCVPPVLFLVDLKEP